MPYRTGELSSNRACPRCRDESSGLRGGTIETFDVEHCANCGGVWIPSAGLNALRTSPKAWAAIRDTYPDEPTTIESVALTCPECGTPMKRRTFQRDSGVMIDHCHLHGVWLDSGELVVLAERFSAQHVAAEKKRALASKSATFVVGPSPSEDSPG